MYINLILNSVCFACLELFFAFSLRVCEAQLRLCVNALQINQIYPNHFSWQVKVNGTMAVSFPAGFVQLLTQSTKYLDELRFSVLNSGQLTRAVVNSDIVQS